ncbi:polyamine aminopropyltransferase [Chloroflexota bacterium]
MKKSHDKWFRDQVNSHLIQLHSIKAVPYTGQTRFQRVDLIDTGSLGQCLVLDGKIQSSEADEFVYHEALVHPPMIAHPDPEKVFIAGGGEGATIREVLAHSSVKRAVMVDLDKEVVDLCRRLLPAFNRGSFDDPRAELYHTDARQYLLDSGERFDVIIIDLPDPLEGGPAYLLYTREFYQLVQESLTSEGIISVQAGSASWGELVNLTAVKNTLETAFSIVCTYQVNIPSFGGPWGFCTASQSLNPFLLPPNEIDRRISSKISASLGSYDGLTHQGMFSLPKHLRQKLSKGKRIISDKKPLFLRQA